MAITHFLSQPNGLLNVGKCGVHFGYKLLEIIKIKADITVDRNIIGRTSQWLRIGYLAGSEIFVESFFLSESCLLYTSDAADE